MCCHKESPFFAKLHTLLPLSFSPGTPKAPVMPALGLSLIHPFRSPRMHNQYPFPTLSRVLPMSFQNVFLSSPSPSLGLYPTTTQTLTLENLNLLQRILELTHWYHCTVPYIIQQDGHTFPSSLHLNTGNYAIYSTP